MAARPSPLLARLRAVAAAWARHQYELVTLAADLADGHEWMLDGSPSAAHWLAAIADVEACTTREWIRIGKLIRTLPASADAFANGRISYSKLRTLTRLATPAQRSRTPPDRRTHPGGRTRPRTGSLAPPHPHRRGGRRTPATAALRQVAPRTRRNDRLLPAARAARRQPLHRRAHHPG